MALYTPPSLATSPALYPMNATLPSLPAELLSWSLWRQSKAPLTPPMTSTFHSRQRIHTTLPPIAHFDRPPLTPPEDLPPPPKYSPPQQLPPIHDPSQGASLVQIHSKPSMPFDPPPVDWFDVTRTRSAHFLAEKTCEMICYLWFSTSSPEQSYPTPNNSPPYLHRPSSSTSTLQLVATPTFVQFMQKLLETTQVSQSVIVLSLHYIYRLKERNRFTPAQSGSEFRIAVAGLMMANKFLDDNTYTNKTWSEVSGIDLPEINRMEKEFLLGVDFNLYVDKPTYESWLNLLKGLVMAKERDSRHFRKARGAVRSSRLPPPSSCGPTTRSYSTYRTPPHRARSTSPTETRNTYPYPSPGANADTPSPTARLGSKRTATDAFSPTSATFAQLPAKRPISISLQIPEFGPKTSGGPHSHSPLEGLQSFARMTLASPHVAQPSRGPHTSTWSTETRNVVPETLVTPYSMDEARRTSVPENLYFYTLSCSPMDRDEESRQRKGKLRYHQPPPPSTTSYYPPRPSIPVVQSASTSPHEHHVHVTSHALPHFHDTRWSQPRNTYTLQPIPRYPSHAIASESPIPSAPFANAGPPGVHSYPTPAQNTSVIPPNYWSRGRQY